jgi:hypothetical protein
MVVKNIACVVASALSELKVTASPLSRRTKTARFPHLRARLRVQLTAKDLIPPQPRQRSVRGLIRC